MLRSLGSLRNLWGNSSSSSSGGGEHEDGSFWSQQQTGTTSPLAAAKSSSHTVSFSEAPDVVIPWAMLQQDQQQQQIVTSSTGKHAFFSRKGSKQHAPKSRNAINRVAYTRRATMEVSLAWSETGFQLENRSRVGVHTMFPLGRSWKASISGSSVMKGRTGYSSGQVEFQKRHQVLFSEGGKLDTNFRTALYLAEGNKPGILLGASATAHSLPALRSFVGEPCTLSFMVNTQPFGAAIYGSEQQKADAVVRRRSAGISKLTLLTSQKVGDWLSLSNTCAIDPANLNSATWTTSLSASRKQQKSSSLFDSWQASFAWSLQRPLLSLHWQPTTPFSSWSAFSGKRKLSLSASWRGYGNGDKNKRAAESSKSNKNTSSRIGGIWELGCQWTQELFDSTRFGISVALQSVGGTTWTFTWQNGDVVLRVPIRLIEAVTSKKTVESLGWSNLLVQSLYLSLVSFVIQDIVVDVLGLADAERQRAQLARQQADMEATKGRSAAEQQQQLMAQQAQRRLAEEEKRHGLIILKAMYYLRNNGGSSTGGDALDVTIPLRFWVTEGSLRLPATSKANMPGFYPLTRGASSENGSTVANGGQTNGSSVGNGFNHHTSSPLHSKNKGGSCERLLSVQYKFSGEPYETTIHDNEELVLPSPAAKCGTREN